MNRKIFLILVLLIAPFVLPQPARADGIVVPDPPICDFCPGPIPISGALEIRYHRVSVTIDDQVAITKVDQVFHNPNDWTVEGTYLFPLPKGAAVTDFKLWIDGQPVEGKVLSAEEARRTYEDIVRKLVDPALLEYAGQGAVQASIFPIPPDGERKIELEYTQVLAAENGLVRYAYPLNTEKFSSIPLEKVSISVDIRSGVPIRAVYSPTHEVDVSREGKNHVVAGYEAVDVLPDMDFVLYYSLGESEAVHLVTFRDPDDPADQDGFYLLLLAPRPEVSNQAQAKDVILVLDRSGSMEGEKFQQAQQAAEYVLRNLDQEDHFNLVVFSTGVEMYASGLRPAKEAGDAIEWMNQQSALGSTDINRALLEAAAMANTERPTYVIFLTDGLPTEGEIDNQRILKNLQANAPSNLRLFAFGVGYDVDTFLLDSLAKNHHGATTYVVPGERIDERVSAFYSKVSTPVLTDLELEVDGVSVYDRFPNPLPDLFAGSQIVLVGRYREGGEAEIRLTGQLNGETQRFRFPDQFFSRNSLDERDALAALPRLWATRKIGFLLNQVRLNGPDQETIDQIVKLSIRYGIVTPYTSYLVTEEMPLGAAEQDRIAAQEYSKKASEPAPSFTGREAVEDAASQGELEGANVVNSPSADLVDRVQVVESRTFVYTNDIWVDTAFDPDLMNTVKVPFLSEDYFQLAETRPELGSAFALGPKVIAFADGVAYEVVSEGTQTNPIEIPVKATPVMTTTPEPAPFEATPVPATPVLIDEEIPDNPDESPSGSFPCVGGFLPIILLPLVLLTKKRNRL